MAPQSSSHAYRLPFSPYAGLESRASTLHNKVGPTYRGRCVMHSAALAPRALIDPEVRPAMFRIRSFAAPALVAGATALLGCNVQKFAANQTVKVAEAGALGFNGFWDYEIFGQAVPAAILQSEALVQIN